jgi:hypothetical protein
VLAVGETEMLPLAGCEPTPLLMETEAAFAVDQVRVELCPEAMEVGLAEKEIVGGGCAVLTVMYSGCLMTRPALSQSWATT